MRTTMLFLLMLLLGTSLSAQSVTFSGTLTARQRAAVVAKVDAANALITAENAACAAAKLANPADPCLAKPTSTYAEWVTAWVQQAIDSLVTQAVEQDAEQVRALFRAASAAKQQAAKDALK